MTIYGTALLSICLMTGLLLGRWIGVWIGVEANVGGVGIAMILLILIGGWMQKRGYLARPTEQGILFWSSIYIPVVVAMAASQNVKAAVSGGAVAMVAGVLVVLVSFLMVPLLGRMGASDNRDCSPTQGSSQDRKDGPFL